MNEREQRVDMIQQRLINRITQATKEGVNISTEDAVQIAFMLDIIRVIIRKTDEILK